MRLENIYIGDTLKGEALDSFVNLKGIASGIGIGVIFLKEGGMPSGNIRSYSSVYYNESLRYTKMILTEKV